MELLFELWTPRCSSGANAGGRPFCHELDIGWVYIGQWIFSMLAISHELFWRKSVFCVQAILDPKNLTGLAGGVREGQNMAQNGPRLCTFLALEPSRDP